MTTIKDAENKMKKSVEHYQTELKHIRTGRANPAILDNVRVEVYGTEMRIVDIAQVTAPEARQLLITPYDAKNSSAIGKAIEKANLGFMPITEANLVRINIPPMDGSMREKMKKTVRELCENTKVSIRQTRQEANKSIKGSKDLAEDEQHKQEEQIQKLTDKYCKEADDLAARKEQEISNV